MKKLIPLILIVLVGCNHPQHNNQAIAVQQFFKLDERLQSVDMSYILDGGTIGMELTDIHGNQSSICIDNQTFGIYIPKLEKDLPETIEFIKRMNQKCVYVGAIYPKYEGAQKIEYHSDLEAAVLAHIEKMMSANRQYHDEFSQFLKAVKTERNLEVIYEDDWDE